MPAKVRAVPSAAGPMSAAPCPMASSIVWCVSWDYSPIAAAVADCASTGPITISLNPKARDPNRSAILTEPRPWGSVYRPPFFPIPQLIHSCLL